MIGCLAVLNKLRLGKNRFVIRLKLDNYRRWTQIVLSLLCNSLEGGFDDSVRKFREPCNIFRAEETWLPAEFEPESSKPPPQLLIQRRRAVIL